MDAAYATEPWHEFAVMVGGAAAALAGLLVVAMSINIEQIVAEKALPRRAAAALIMTVFPSILSMCILIPDQSTDVLGIELILLAAALGASVPRFNRPSTRTGHQTVRQWVGSALIPMLLLLVPLLLAGIGMITTSLGGMYWLPVAVFAALFGGLVQAWVLLVEIRR